MYVDDTYISFTARSVKDLNLTMNKELDSLRKLLQGNKLSLNVLKTHAMVIGSRPSLKKISTKLVEPPSFSIGGSEVELVDNVKYLGVQIPDYLSQIFTKKSACSRENLRNTATDLQIPLAKTCSGQRTFSYRGARVWNHLDLAVKQTSSFKAFKDAVNK